MPEVTVFEYMYRDAANHKVHDELMLDRILTSEEKDLIRTKCDDGLYFLALQVGLGMLQEQFAVLDREDDHIWHEFTGFSERFVPVLDDMKQVRAGAFVWLWKRVESWNEESAQLSLDDIGWKSEGAEDD